MTDWLLGLVPQYGVWLLAAGTFLSCLALPIPASILMMTAGGFAASGDLSLTASIAAALAGAVAGDQTGYLGGRFGGSRLVAGFGASAAPLAKATKLLAERGGLAVFLTRWLISALGPYVNFAAGAARQRWAMFTFWSVAGESCWVSLYVGLGFFFTGNLEAASALAVDILGILGAGTAALGLGYWLAASLRADAADR